MSFKEVSMVLALIDSESKRGNTDVQKIAAMARCVVAKPQNIQMEALITNSIGR